MGPHESGHDVGFGYGLNLRKAASGIGVARPVGELDAATSSASSSPMLEHRGQDEDGHFSPAANGGERSGHSGETGACDSTDRTGTWRGALHASASLVGTDRNQGKPEYLSPPVSSSPGGQAEQEEADGHLEARSPEYHLKAVPMEDEDEDENRARDVIQGQQDFPSAGQDANEEDGHELSGSASSQGSCSSTSAANPLDDQEAWADYYECYARQQRLEEEEANRVDLFPCSQEPEVCGCDGDVPCSGTPAGEGTRSPSLLEGQTFRAHALQCQGQTQQVAAAMLDRVSPLCLAKTATPNAQVFSLPTHLSLVPLADDHMDEA
jgi:hypothetical protein